MKQMTLRIKDGALVGMLDGGAEFRASEGPEPRQKEFVVKTPEGDYVAKFEAIDSDDDEKKALKAELAELRKKIKESEAKPVEVDGGAATLAADAETAAKFDALSAKVAKMEAERDAEKAEKAVSARAAAAIAGLRKDGYHVSDYTASKIATFAASGDDAVNGFVEHYRKVVPKDGPRVLDDGDAARTDPVMAKFSALGAEVNDVAIEAAATFENLTKLGLKEPGDREGFITRFMANRGVKVAG